MDLIVVTAPVHPFYQQELKVIRYEREQNGARFVCVRHPTDGFLRLPIDWTDRGTKLSPPIVEGRELLIDVKNLQKLAAACAVALAADIDGEKVVMKAPKPSGRRDRRQDGGKRKSLGEVGGTRKTENTWGLGHSSSQNDLLSGQEGDQ